jgi:hypothetical protein
MIRSMLTVTMVLATLTGCGQPMTAVAPAARQPVAQAQAAATDRLLALAKNEVQRFDTSKNGTLSSKEYSDGRFAELRFVKAPSASETATLKAGFAKTYGKLDLNKDGQLTASELKAEYTS